VRKAKVTYINDLFFRKEPLSDKEVLKLLLAEEKRQQTQENENFENEPAKPAKKGKFTNAPPGTADISSFFAPKR
jgi:hypothetical protein